MDEFEIKLSLIFICRRSIIFHKNNNGDGGILKNIRFLENINIYL